MLLKYSKKAILLMIVLLMFLNPVLGLVFEEQGTKYINITINHDEIIDLRFNITGSEHGGILPNNITIDITNNSIADWKYYSYHSSQPQQMEVFEINHAFSNNQGNTEIHLINISENSFDDSLLIGRLENNAFQKIAGRSGFLGLASMDNLNEQIIYITGEETMHVFVPQITTDYNLGLYVAQGGSTYFCNSDKEEVSTNECNLDFEQATSGDYLARAAGEGFGHTESIRGDNTVEGINDYIKENCGEELPCEVPVKVSVETPGMISFSDFDVIPVSTPADIQIEDTGGEYSVKINNDTLTLEESYYFFGTMPKVHIVPVVSADDSQTYNLKESELMEYINENLAESWDNLTENKHPLEFTFHNEPYKLQNYYMGEDYSRFTHEIGNDLKDNLELDYPSILVVVDIHNYFPERESYNLRRSVGVTDTKIISEIYINGFGNDDYFNNNTRYLERLFLHELMHSFLGYPGGDMFYNDHPASYSDDLDLDIFDTSFSPTGEEGYFEIYSIMNQLRVMIHDSEIGQPPSLSPLDKMLLGTLSPHTQENYTLYDVGITKENNIYYVDGGINPVLQYNATELYHSSSDYLWWDVRRNSSIVDMGQSTQYDIPKPNGNNKALWVYGNDRIHGENFKVYSSGSSVKNDEGSIHEHTVLVPRIIFNRDGFNDEETTDFSELDKDSLERADNVTFTRIGNKARVKFIEPINISRDLNLNNNIIIGDRWFYLNPVVLPEFNKDARLTFYDLDMQEPIPQRDGSECPQEICINRIYENNTFSFEVKGFSNYSVSDGFTEEENGDEEEETESGDDSDGSDDGSTRGGRSGGGGGLPPMPVGDEDEDTSDEADDSDDPDDKDEKEEENGDEKDEAVEEDQDDEHEEDVWREVEQPRPFNETNGHNGEIIYKDEENGISNGQLAFFVSIALIVIGSVLGLLIHFLVDRRRKSKIN